VPVEVHHEGDPPELFKAGEPVVLEGRWDRSVDVFASDRMLVKHDETYDEANKDRIVEAEQGGSVPATSEP
jgi:cytochrome c-type biogenesis protein CcmE